MKYSRWVLQYDEFIFLIRGFFRLHRIAEVNSKGYAKCPYFGRTFPIAIRYGVWNGKRHITCWIRRTLIDKSNHNNETLALTEFYALQHSEDYPQLKGSQVALVRAEASTGIILLPSGAHRLGVGPRFTTFQSVTDAEQYAQKFIQQHPFAECSLTISPDNYFRLIRANSDYTRGI